MLVFILPTLFSLPPRSCTKALHEHLGESTNYFQVLKNNAAFHLHLICMDQKSVFMISSKICKGFFLSQNLLVYDLI